MRIDRSFAERLIESARAKGADYAEAYVKSARNLSVDVKGQDIDAVESSVDIGYSLRVIKDRRLGFSYSTDMKELEAVVENAVEASRWTEQDDYLGLPETSDDISVETFDDAIASLTEGDAADRALLIEKTAIDADRRIRKVRKASASFSRKDVLILNSNGVDKCCSSTACTGQITLVAEDGKDSQMGWDFTGSRFLRDIDFGEVGRNAAMRALQLLGAKKMQAQKAHVILDNSVAVEFLGIFATLLSSEYVQKGKSLLAGKLNREVVSPVISILDDGTIPHKLGSRPFDDEGVATSQKYLIKAGALVNYMYNAYTARKDGVKSTGNAVKGGFSALPAVGPTNLYIEASPEHVHSGCLSSLVDSGIYVTEAMGIHTANPVSGEFSIGVSGLWIEKGDVRFPVKEAVISGNILDFFSRVEAVGGDPRFYGNMASPSLLVRPVDVSA